jgi:hypothetical protein
MALATPQVLKKKKKKNKKIKIKITGHWPCPKKIYISIPPIELSRSVPAAATLNKFGGGLLGFHL